MFWTTVLFVFDLLSRLDKHGSSYIENDLKGKENWFELSRVRVIGSRLYYFQFLEGTVSGFRCKNCLNTCSYNSIRITVKGFFQRKTDYNQFLTK